jgi:CRP-like cAMP-binding protein
MTEAGSIRVCDMSETVYHEGTTADYVYFVEEGQFIAFRSDRKDKIQLEQHKTGAVLGLFDVMYQRPYTKTVESVAGGRLRMLDRAQIMAEVENADSFVRTLLKLTMSRLEKQSKNGCS